MLQAGENWRDWHGWGQDRFLLVDIYDALERQFVYGVPWGKDGPKFEPHPARPKAKPVEPDPAEKKPGRLRELFRSMTSSPNAQR